MVFHKSIGPVHSAVVILFAKNLYTHRNAKETQQSVKHI